MTPSYVPDSSTELVQRLVDRVPVLRPAYEEHLADYDLVLPHVFFGDVTRWAVASYIAGDNGWRTLVAFLEEEYADADYDAQAVIEQSFVENLPYPHEEGYGIEREFGPRLTEMYRQQRPS